MSEKIVELIKEASGKAYQYDQNDLDIHDLFNMYSKGVLHNTREVDDYSPLPQVPNIIESILTESYVPEFVINEEQGYEDLDFKKVSVGAYEIRELISFVKFGVPKEVFGQRIYFHDLPMRYRDLIHARSFWVVFISPKKEPVKTFLDITLELTGRVFKDESRIKSAVASLESTLTSIGLKGDKVKVNLVMKENND